ncbi:hypothetical protein [Vibrio europaeus]|uniref:DUF945 domain-containing protein n=1 Tax=Vibrio europaeus TaxID=300876 RepID=A0ABT5GRM3_9VIBR|nr:hypothetical protein [Vibrio europaeus]MDC5725702.1 hypothetical protein [Vibrio europaeus]MDC5728304.1 hypothetical protein [Vibrio europaeus]MDC5734516.1 hypothetical protein [Vibrio europaeus]MDC5739797.1 hypothetical protein [Vibrio europaeus]
MLAQYFDRIDESIDALLATDLTETQKKAILALVKDSSEEVLASYNRAVRAETKVNVMKTKYDTICLSAMDAARGVH